MHYLYILKSDKSGRLYLGQTSDLRKRFSQHNAGQSKATKYGIPWKLVYYEAFASATDARIRERQLKKFGNSYSALKKRLQNSLENS